MSDPNKLTLIWQIKEGQSACFEGDWIRELFGDCIQEEIQDGEWKIVQDFSVVIYSDMFGSDFISSGGSPYPEHQQESLRRTHEVRSTYFSGVKKFKKCFLIHLSDEFCHADISHYSLFSHVFRNYFRADAQAENVSFFPLGYKKGFGDPPLSLSLAHTLVPEHTPLPKKRYGQNADGGYVFLENFYNQAEIVYSYGIGDSLEELSFDLACADSGKKVFLYDGTIMAPHTSHPSFKFTKENLTPDNFRDHIKANGHNDERNMILKIDIEGCEYDVLDKNIDILLKHFPQLAIEFHGINNPTFYTSIDKNKVFAKLLKEYTVIHMHANNWIARENSSTGEYLNIPNVLEISLIKKGLTPTSIDKEAYPKEGLDFPNCPSRPDYILDWWLPSEEREFPFVKKLSEREIPKIIHLSWKNKNLLSNPALLIQNGVGRLSDLNPDWEIEVSDDEDVERYLRDYLGAEDYQRLRGRKMVEKSDLWRLLKVYNEGGLYMDIDRYYNVPLANIIKPGAKCVLPTYFDVDFSQDIVGSVPANPLYERAIYSNLEGRKAEKPLFYLAVESYMLSVTEVLTGRAVSRSPGLEFWNRVRHQLHSSPALVTAKEEGPFNTILYQHEPSTFLWLDGSPTGDLEKEYITQKALFYNSEKVTHWNMDDQIKFTQINENKPS